MLKFKQILNILFALLLVLSLTSLALAHPAEVAEDDAAIYCRLYGHFWGSWNERSETYPGGECYIEETYSSRHCYSCFETESIYLGSTSHGHNFFYYVYPGGGFSEMICYNCGYGILNPYYAP